jgi:protein gp37
MGDNSKIEWTEHSMNFWIGCTEVSPGCDNCYARTLAGRYGWTTWGKGEPRIRTAPANWRKPLTWERKAAASGERPKVFTNSLADFFDPEVDPQWREDAWNVIRQTPHLDWQILTKRPNLIKRRLPPDWGDGWPHVWLGTSVEHQSFMWRVEALLRVPNSIPFLSCEPLLSSLSFTRIDGLQGPYTDWLKGEVREVNCGEEGVYARFRPIKWVIVGAESGPGARPMEQQWVRDIRDQCVEAGTAFFYKQDAKNGHKIPTPELDGQRWMQFPTALSRRQASEFIDILKGGSAHE